MINFGDSLLDVDGSSIKSICSAYKAQLLYLPVNNFQLELHNYSMSSFMHTKLACCRRSVDNSGDGATDICPGTCIFQEIVQGKVGMKFSTIVENEELCISALHESSGNFWMSSVVLDLAFFYSKGPLCLPCNFHFLPPKLLICDNPC